jgi:hypothetical protein
MGWTGRAPAPPTCHGVCRTGAHQKEHAHVPQARRPGSVWFPNRCPPVIAQSLAALPSGEMATCACSSCRQPASSCYALRTGQSTASDLGWLRLLNGCITMCWLPRSPTSWHALHGVCLSKAAATRRASRPREHDMDLLRFTKGMAAIPSSPRHSPGLLSERRWLRRDGKADREPDVGTDSLPRSASRI